MNIKPELLRGIYYYDDKQPCLLRQHTLMNFIKGKDILIQASSEYRKRSILCITALQSLDDQLQQPQVIILTYTRELCNVFKNVLWNYCQSMNSIKYYDCCYFTSENQNQIHQQGYQIIIGTPGRVYDLIRRHLIPLDFVKLILLDEMDELFFNRGLDDIVYDLMNYLSNYHHHHRRRHQFIASSSFHSLETSNKIIDIVKNKLMYDSIQLITVQQTIPNQFNQHIKQYYINIEKEEWKLDTLFDLLDEIKNHSSLKMVMFCNTFEKIDWLIKQLHQQQQQLYVTTISPINNDTSIVDDDQQQEQEHKMKTFYTGSGHRLLIITDECIDLIDTKQIPIIIK
ncbi:unnamed protein product [Cunninghamella blakesleeana]